MINEYCKENIPKTTYCLKIYIMKSANPENEYIPLDLRISVRRDTLRLISEMAQDMGISINEVFSFLAEDSVIDLELMEDLNKIDIPSKCSIDDLKNALLKKRLC